MIDETKSIIGILYTKKWPGGELVQLLSKKVPTAMEDFYPGVLWPVVRSEGRDASTIIGLGAEGKLYDVQYFNYTRGKGDRIQAYTEKGFEDFRPDEIDRIREGLTRLRAERDQA